MPHSLDQEVRGLRIAKSVTGDLKLRVRAIAHAAQIN